jgi:hypothetical protein
VREPVATRLHGGETVAKYTKAVRNLQLEHAYVSTGTTLVWATPIYPSVTLSSILVKGSTTTVCCLAKPVG